MHIAIRAAVLAVGLFTLAAHAQKLELNSPDVESGRMIGNKFVFNGFNCTGENVSPALRWQNPPRGTQSFALLVHDADAPTGGAGFWHWLVVNIPASASGLEQGAGSADGARLPAGSVQLKSDFGTLAWGGPCPPPGDKPHRYTFTLYALKVEKLTLPPDATSSLAGFIVNANSIGKAKMTPVYRRSK